MIRIGDIVCANTGLSLLKRLYLWSDFDDIKGDVNDKELLLVIDIMSPDKSNHSPQWEEGACKVLGPNGITGWVGQGWIKLL